MLLLNKYFTFCVSSLPRTKFEVFPSPWDFKGMRLTIGSRYGNTAGARRCLVDRGTSPHANQCITNSNKTYWPWSNQRRAALHSGDNVTLSRRFAPDSIIPNICRHYSWLKCRLRACCCLLWQHWRWLEQLQGYSSPFQVLLCCSPTGLPYMCMIKHASLLW